MKEGGSNEIVGGSRVVSCHPYEVQSIGGEAGTSGSWRDFCRTRRLEQGKS